MVNSVPRPQAMQTDRTFGDGEVRIRFQCQDQSWMGFNMRLGTTPGYAVEFDRGDVVRMAGAERTLIFSCRGETVSATLDGRPIRVTVRERSRVGTLHFSTVGGQLRIRSIDFREPKP
jgi:hypothetical protein